MSDETTEQAGQDDITMDAGAMQSVAAAVSADGDASMAREFSEQVRANIDRLSLDQHYMIANSLASMSAAAFGAERERKSLTVTVDPMSFVLVLQAASVVFNDACLAKWGNGTEPSADEQPKPE